MREASSRVDPPYLISTSSGWLVEGMMVTLKKEVVSVLMLVLVFVVM